MVSSSDDPLAAAVAAAAELARNGGDMLFAAAAGTAAQLQHHPRQAELPRPIVASPQPPTAANVAVAAAPFATLNSTSSSDGAVIEAAAAALANFPVRFPLVSPLQHAQRTSQKTEEELTPPLLPSPSVGNAKADTRQDENEKYQGDAVDEEDGCDEVGSQDDSKEDADSRIARSRERNREHARRTRIRKKAQLESLQSKVKELQAESKVLKQSLEECSIASILVGLSSGERDATIQALLKEANEIENREIFKIVGGKRKRFAADSGSGRTGAATTAIDNAVQPLTIFIDGKATVIGGSRTHINWKTGVYCDENGVQRQLKHEQLEALRYVRLLRFVGVGCEVALIADCSCESWLLVSSWCFFAFLFHPQSRTQPHARQDDTRS